MKVQVTGLESPLTTYRQSGFTLAFSVQRQTAGCLALPLAAAVTPQAAPLAHPHRAAAGHLPRHAAITTTIVYAHALAIGSVSAHVAAGTASLLAATSGMVYEC